MKKYDFKKAKEIIDKNKDQIVSASLGMHEDWFWTAETVYEDGSYCGNILSGESIGGIGGSSSATPTLQLVFKDETEKMIPVYTGDSDNGKPSFLSLGCMSQPVQDNITPLSAED